jgi:hypothetical protein
MGSHIMKWTDLAQDRYQWWVLGNKVMNHLNSMALVREQNTRTERPPLVGEVSAYFCDRGCRVVSTMNSDGRILGFLDRVMNHRIS